MCQQSQQSAFIAFHALTAIPTAGEEMQTSVCAANVLHFLKQLLNIFVFLSLTAFSTRSAHVEERSMKKPSTALTHVCMISWSGHTYSRWTDVQTKILTSSSNGRFLFVFLFMWLRCWYYEMLLGIIFSFVTQKYLMRIKHLIKMSPFILFQGMHHVSMLTFLSCIAS